MDLGIPKEQILATVWLIVGTAVVDTATGIWGAIKGGTFEWKFLDQFLRAHVLTRITPIAITMAAALMLTGPTRDLLWTALIAEVAAYEAATVKSILQNLRPGGNVPDNL